MPFWRLPAALCANPSLAQTALKTNVTAAFLLSQMIKAQYSQAIDEELQRVVTGAYVLSPCCYAVKVGLVAQIAR